MRSFCLADLDAHLCYLDLSGQQPTCVYLHGLGSSALAEFAHLQHDSRLAPHRAVLVDLLGFGFSDRPAAFTHTLAAC